MACSLSIATVTTHTEASLGRLPELSVSMPTASPIPSKSQDRTKHPVGLSAARSETFLTREAIIIPDDEPHSRDTVADESVRKSIPTYAAAEMKSNARSLRPTWTKPNNRKAEESDTLPESTDFLTLSEDSFSESEKPRRAKRKRVSAIASSEVTVDHEMVF